MKKAIKIIICAAWFTALTPFGVLNCLLDLHSSWLWSRAERWQKIDYAFGRWFRKLEDPFFKYLKEVRNSE